ncbi:coenzyme F420-0:L-glutamate ligase [Plantactinospora sp. S1510]|uniref:Coenzyme F420-0:L-glutamate ligase n=1 Tax=Plantactinospora alkalitolerans TaxID=2789879 RepID=A0ABS0GWN7_9ACTN|nr:coenzyme F420-0:L-glutamate ligase [Plantactinospora alkalitolerans]MBF9130344.1 coenzyme F420-0:L-glutamate ligase [Plantactinospora alkalitolerans]
MRLEVLPVLGIGDVTEGDDLAALISTAAPWLRDGDVLVVTSKIVSKAEGRMVDVPVDGPEREAARIEILAGETARPVARRGATRIVQTHHGFVMASAGIDASNVDRSRLVLLPKDPDASARGLRAAIREQHGADVAIIVSDTMGRPWRNGLTDVALGVAGMPAVRDHRGEVDPYGNKLSITQMAVVDELAGAGELVKGKCDQVPVAVIRGYLNAAEPDDGAGAAALVRDAAHDLFALGTAEARAEGLRAAATLGDSTTPTGRRAAGPDEPTGLVDLTAVNRAIGTVAGVVTPGTVFTLVNDERVRYRLGGTSPTGPISSAAPGTTAPSGATALIDCWPPRPPASHGTDPYGAASALGANVVDPGALIRFGADLHRLRAALAAEGVDSTVLPAPAGAVGATLVVTGPPAPVVPPL